MRGDVDEPFDKTWAQLKAERLDERLDQLESSVWGRIDAGRCGHAGSLLPVHAAAVATALVLGVAVGGLGVAEVRPGRGEVSIFSIEARLAPSTLLHGQ